MLKTNNEILDDEEAMLRCHRAIDFSELIDFGSSEWKNFSDGWDKVAADVDEEYKKKHGRRNRPQRMGRRWI